MAYRQDRESKKEYLPDGTTFEWVSPSQCRWEEQQVKWILVWLDLILTGFWPDVTGVLKSDNPPWKFYGETARLNAIEVTDRIGKTGRDGDFCMTFYHDKFSYDKLARFAGISVEEMDKRISQVIRYISGFSRKERTYEEFVKHKKHRR